ncbi:MAG: eight-cysteine-cluster domain-containing protein [Candidatus ainarchaeum sp.]|nr:eight-cysteine-cluster domain-containing protein [Candidatus ainarchaeum sp.]
MRFRLAIFAGLCVAFLATSGCISWDWATPAPTPTPAATATPLPPDGECASDSQCVVSGCSGQVCANRSVVTTCEYRPEYACYGLTSCGCVGGRCAWRETPEFAACLENASGARAPGSR